MELRVKGIDRLSCTSHIAPTSIALLLEIDDNIVYCHPATNRWHTLWNTLWNVSCREACNPLERLSGTTFKF